MSTRRIVGSLATLTAAALGIGGGVALAGYWRHRRWLRSLDLLEDPAFAFPLVRTGGFWLPLDMYKGAEAAKDIELGEEDVIVASFPKSGTTWLQEIVFLLMHDLNYIKAGASTMEERFPYLEYVFPGPAIVAARPPPRLLKTHLPANLLPPSARQRARLLYIVRDPKDVLVSYFHFARMFAPARYSGNPEDFKHRFLRSQRLPYAPWSDHVRSYMTLRSERPSHVLVVTYEQLSRDPHGTVRRIADFLGKGAGFGEAELNALVRHCSFEAMRANPACNYRWWDALGLRRTGADSAEFMREGRVGGWRAMLSPEEAAEADQRVREAGLQGLWSER